MDEDIEYDSFTHFEMIEITNKTLKEVFEKDSMLNNIPTDITLDEVMEKIAVIHGLSMTIYVMRADGEEIPVVVKHKDATVQDLKQAICRQMIRRLNRKSQKVKVSWRFVWKSYDLVIGKQRLKNDKTLLADWNIKNKSRIFFVKRLKKKRNYLLEEYS
uniref:SNRNP25 ubiquitin-like domain-containing protein n=1 Tax=Clastoptera arizonana TaxID=38151 RepID=A0A1B6CTK3_9HEMI